MNQRKVIKQSGFAVFEVIILVAVLLVLGFVIYKGVHKSQVTQSTSSKVKTADINSKADLKSAKSDLDKSATTDAATDSDTNSLKNYKK